MKPGSSQDPARSPGAHNVSAQTGAEANDAPSFDRRWLGAVISIDRWHFHRRLLERYEITLGPSDYSRISRSIARGRAPLIKSSANGVGVYLVQVPSCGALVFVGAKQNGELITAMPVTERLLALVRLAVM